MAVAGQDAAALAARLTFTALDADNVHVALNTFKLGVVPDVAPARVVAVINVSGSMEEVCMGVFFHLLLIKRGLNVIKY